MMQPASQGNLVIFEEGDDWELGSLVQVSPSTNGIMRIAQHSSSVHKGIVEGSDIVPNRRYQPFAADTIEKLYGQQLAREKKISVKNKLLAQRYEQYMDRQEPTPTWLPSVQDVNVGKLHGRVEIDYVDYAKLYEESDVILHLYKNDLSKYLPVNHVTVEVRGVEYGFDPDSSDHIRRDEFFNVVKGETLERGHTIKPGKLATAFTRFAGVRVQPVSRSHAFPLTPWLLKQEDVKGSIKKGLESNFHVRSILLGSINVGVTREDIDNLIISPMLENWTRYSYGNLTHNCIHFAQDFVTQLKNHYGSTAEISDVKWFRRKLAKVMPTILGLSEMMSRQGGLSSRGSARVSPITIDDFDDDDDDDEEEDGPPPSQAELSSNPK
jgi:hypothetical protein